MSPEYCDGFVRLLRRVDAQTGRKMLTSKAVLAFMAKEKLPLATILRPEVLGHPNTLAVMGDLATDYISAGRHDRAIGLEEATFSSVKKLLVRSTLIHCAVWADWLATDLLVDTMSRLRKQLYQAP